MNNSFDMDLSLWRSEFGRFQAAEAEAVALRDGLQLTKDTRGVVADDVVDVSLRKMNQRLASAQDRAERAFSACGTIATRLLERTASSPAQCLDLLEVRAAHIVVALGGTGQSEVVADAFERTRLDLRAVIDPPAC